jgi:hypothetical protein
MAPQVMEAYKLKKQRNRVSKVRAGQRRPRSWANVCSFWLQRILWANASSLGLRAAFRRLWLRGLQRTLFAESCGPTYM